MFAVSSQIFHSVLFFHLLSDLLVVSTLNNQGLKDHNQFSAALPIKKDS